MGYNNAHPCYMQEGSMWMLSILHTQACVLLKLGEALHRASAPAQTTDENATTDGWTRTNT